MRVCARVSTTATISLTSDHDVAILGGGEQDRRMHLGDGQLPQIGRISTTLGGVPQLARSHPHTPAQPPWRTRPRASPLKICLVVTNSTAISGYFFINNPVSARYTHAKYRSVTSQSLDHKSLVYDDVGACRLCMMYVCMLYVCGRFSDSHAAPFHRHTGWPPLMMSSMLAKDAVAPARNVRIVARFAVYALTMANVNTAPTLICAARISRTAQTQTSHRSILSLTTECKAQHFAERCLRIRAEHIGRPHALS
jgi:hypothetical protein